MEVYLCIPLDAPKFSNTSSYGRSAVLHAGNDLLINTKVMFKMFGLLTE